MGQGLLCGLSKMTWTLRRPRERKPGRGVLARGAQVMGREGTRGTGEGSPVGGVGLTLQQTTGRCLWRQGACAPREARAQAAISVNGGK